MKYIIWASIGAVIALAGLVYLLRLAVLKIKGTETEAEVVSVREKKPGDYRHTLRFSDGKNTYEHEDKAGFSQPFSVGSKHRIIYDPKKPENFDFADQLKKNIIIIGVLVGMAVLFVVRWYFLGKSGL